jgi:hypothetical protein
MKLGRSLQDLAIELDRQAKTKRDYLAHTQAIRMEPAQDGAVLLQGINGGMALRPIAHGQIASSLAIPKPYYDRMLSDAPDLLASNVNRWLHAQPARKLVRTLDNSVRAFLSDSYRPLDNFDLAEAALPKLSSLACRVVSCEVTESRFYLKAVTDRIAGEVKKGDVIQAGLVISNSEVGHGSLRVEALDYRLVCTNGVVRESAIRKAHLGRSNGRGYDAIEDAREYFRDETRKADDKAFFLKVQDAVGAMFDEQRFNARIEQYREASERRIEADPVQVVEKTADRLALAETERSSVLKHLVQGADLSAWGLANAVTRTAEDARDYDRASELEAIGAEVIELAPHEWRTLAAES